MNGEHILSSFKVDTPRYPFVEMVKILRPPFKFVFIKKLVYFYIYNICRNNNQELIPSKKDLEPDKRKILSSSAFLRITVLFLS